MNREPFPHHEPDELEHRNNGNDSDFEIMARHDQVIQVRGMALTAAINALPNGLTAAQLDLAGELEKWILRGLDIR